MLGGHTQISQPGLETATARSTNKIFIKALA
jgi:hypothetical protein